MNVAIVTKVKPRLLLQHSRPDHEVSKPSSDSHRSLTSLEHACREWRQSIRASSWDPPPGYFCLSEFDLAMTSLQNCPKAEPKASQL